MENNYECPKCHNRFPIQNKIMHDARCTEENPMPLDKSRLIVLDKLNNAQKKDNENINQEKPPEVISKKQESKNE